MRKSRNIKSLTRLKYKKRLERDLRFFERFLKENYFINIDVSVESFRKREVLGVREFLCSKVKGLVLYELVTTMQNKIKQYIEEILKEEIQSSLIAPPNRMMESIFFSNIIPLYNIQYYI